MGRLFLTLIGVFVIVGSFSLAIGSEADDLFASANKLYEEEKYSEALEQYLQIAEDDYESAPLFYNIGNCYIKENKYGYAILFYLKAEKIDPSDEEIKTNLEFARQFMPTQLEGVRINPVNTFFDSITGPFTLESLAWGSSLLFIIALLSFSYVIFFRHNNIGIRIGVYIFLILFISLSLLTTYKYRADIITKSGVLVSDEATVYSSPNANGEIEFIGAYGLMVEIEKTKDNFYLVIFENKRKGWVKQSDIGII